MKLNVGVLCRTALLLALCIASQFLKNTSVYITGSIVNAILIISTLSCGFLSAAAISVIAPLTSWWITGSPIMSAYPVIVPLVMISNLIIVACVWLFAKYLDKKFSPVEQLPFSDVRFRLVILIVFIACALWAAITIAFISTITTALQFAEYSTLLVVILSLIVGVFLVFVCLWALVSRFPNTWAPIAGMVIGSVIKAMFLWIAVVKIVLPDGAPGAVKLTFSVAQLLTALIGSVLAFLVWLPLKKVITE